MSVDKYHGRKAFKICLVYGKHQKRHINVLQTAQRNKSLPGAFNLWLERYLVEI